LNLKRKEIKFSFSFRASIRSPAIDPFFDLVIEPKDRVIDAKRSHLIQINQLPDLFSQKGS
jgi:hypothetical protein